MEQLVIFLPALYASAYFVLPLYAVGAGVVFLVGRAVYFRAYSRDAEKRAIDSHDFSTSRWMHRQRPSRSGMATWSSGWM